MAHRLSRMVRRFVQSVFYYNLSGCGRFHPGRNRFPS